MYRLLDPTFPPVTDLRQLFAPSHNHQRILVDLIAERLGFDLPTHQARSSRQHLFPMVHHGAQLVTPEGVYRLTGYVLTLTVQDVGISPTIHHQSIGEARAPHFSFPMPYRWASPGHHSLRYQQWMATYLGKLYRTGRRDIRHFMAQLETMVPQMTPTTRLVLGLREHGLSVYLIRPDQPILAADLEAPVRKPGKCAALRTASDPAVTGEAWPMTLQPTP